MELLPNQPIRYFILFYSNWISYGYYSVKLSDASIRYFQALDAITTCEHGNSHETGKDYPNGRRTRFSLINSAELFQNLTGNSSEAEVEKLTNKLGEGLCIGFKTVADKYGIIIFRSLPAAAQRKCHHRHESGKITRFSK